MNGLGGDVFGGQHDASPCSHQMERERQDNGDAARNAAYQRKQDEQKLTPAT